MAKYIYFLLFFTVLFCDFSGEQRCLQQQETTSSSDYLAEGTAHKGTFTGVNVFDINLIKDTHSFRVSEFGKRAFNKKAPSLLSQVVLGEPFIKLAINGSKSFLFKCLTGAAIVFPFHYFF